MQIGLLEAERMPNSLQHYGSFADLFANLLDGYSFERYFVMEGQFPLSVASCDAYLITGSTHGAYEKIPWIKHLKQFIREINNSNRPLIGVCFGHQIIAEALGGKVERFEGGWGVGRHQYNFHQTVSGPTLEQETLTINAFHQDQVTKLPEGAEVFASSDFCKYAGIAYGKNILTVQAHPEFSLEFETDLTADEISTIVPQSIRTAALADLRLPCAKVDNQLVARMMKEFLDLSR